MPHYTLTFGRSSSPHYAAATALAAQIPGTTVTGGDGVAVHAVPLDAESLPALGALLELVVHPLPEGGSDPFASALSDAAARRGGRRHTQLGKSGFTRPTVEGAASPARPLDLRIPGKGSSAEAARLFKVSGAPSAARLLLRGEHRLSGIFCTDSPRTASMALCRIDEARG